MEYQQQELKGARLIVEKIKELANESNIEITKIEWDGSTLIIDRKDFHTLKVFIENNSIQEKFYVGEFADFTPDYGDTIKKIRNMIRILKSSMMDNNIDKSLSKEYKT